HLERVEGVSDERNDLPHQARNRWVSTRSGSNLGALRAPALVGPNRHDIGVGEMAAIVSMSGSPPFRKQRNSGEAPSIFLTPMEATVAPDLAISSRRFLRCRQE